MIRLLALVVAAFFLAACEKAEEVEIAPRHAIEKARNLEHQVQEDAESKRKQIDEAERR
jgi:hypothetical protein